MTAQPATVTSCSCDSDPRYCMGCGVCHCPCHEVPAEQRDYCQLHNDLLWAIVASTSLAEAQERELDVQEHIADCSRCERHEAWLLERRHHDRQQDRDQQEADDAFRADHPYDYNGVSQGAFE